MFEIIPTRFQLPPGPQPPCLLHTALEHTECSMIYGNIYQWQRCQITVQHGVKSIAVSLHENDGRENFQIICFFPSGAL